MVRALFIFIIFIPSLVWSFDAKQFTYQDKFPQGLDLFRYSKPNKLSTTAKVKWYQLHSDWKNCALQSESLKQDRDLGVWPAYIHLRCLDSLRVSRSGWKTSRFLDSFKKLSRSKEALLSSPYQGHKEAYLDLFLDLAQLASENNRDRFNNFIQSHQDLVDHMDEDQRAQYYRVMGEIAWLEQKNEIAKENYLRSYRFSPSNVVLQRIKELKAEAILKLDKYQFDFTESQEENKLWGKFASAMQSGHSFKVAQYGSEFLSEFPGSKRVSEVQDGVNRFYKRLLYRRGAKYESAKKDFHRQLKKAPAASILYWATEAYERGYMDSSYELADRAAELWEDSPRAAQALILEARSAYYLARQSDAIDSLKKIIEKYSGSEASDEAHYLLGMLYYRKGEYKKVIKLYEKFLQSSGSDKYELQVRYWLWWSLKKIDSSRSKEIADSIMKVFPLTYYGLVVRMEEEKGLQNLLGSPVAKKIKTQYWWTANNKSRWARIKKLISVGWVDEAETEIDFLPEPQTADSFVIRAKLWRSALRENRAIQDYAAAIDLETDYITQPLMAETFPVKYEKAVLKAEKEFNLSKNIIWAVIRQESAFMPRAVSPSNAYGLMQMLSPTAKETARWLRVKNFRLSRDIVDPQINIRFGTHFLSRMVKKYKGVIPLAIASYNVGPGNLDRWLSHRVDLSNWDQIGKSPDDDMWMDELPWAETSFYVKAVLRNYLLYKVVHEKYNQLAKPAWSEIWSNEGA